MTNEAKPAKLLKSPQSSSPTLADAPVPKQIKLTEAQQLVLVRASQNTKGELIKPLPEGSIGTAIAEGVFGSTANDRRMIKAFWKKGLLEGDPDDLYSLRLTAAAFEALHIDEVEWPEHLRWKSIGLVSVDGSKTDVVAQSANLPRSGSKGATVLALLKRKSGATLTQLESATGWQRHSVRGFLSGTVRKKLGQTIESRKPDGEDRIYRVIGKAVVQ